MGAKTVRAAAVFAFCVAAVSIPGTASAAPPLRTIFCGMPVYSSLRADNDLPNCPFNGLIVLENDVTIDLNGHTIDGNATDNDAGVEYGVGTTSGFSHSGLKIINGTITDFEAGINFEGGRGLKVSNVRSTANGEGVRVTGTVPIPNVVLSNNVLWKNSSDGVQADHTPGIKVVGNVTSGNGDEGIEIVDLAGPATVERNVATGNGDMGISVVGATKGTISSNDASRNARHGIAVEQGGKDVALTGNMAAGNGDHGLTTFSSDGLLFEGNTALGNEKAGIYLSSSPRTDVVGNTVSGNREGIDMFESDYTRILRNRAHGNQDVGIRPDGSDITVGGNKAHGNGFGIFDGAGWGIDTTSVTTNLKFSLNTAIGNDDLSECSNGVICRDNNPPSTSDFPLTTVACGDAIEKSIRVNNDLFGCPLTGLIANKSGITIDLNGHVIGGDAAGTEPGIFVGYVNNVTIANGLVTGFEDGIVVTAKGITLRNLSSVGNEGNGIAAGPAVELAIGGGAYTHNDNSGVRAIDVDGLTVKGVVATGNDEGVFADSSTKVALTGNVLGGNLAGVSVRQVANAILTGNQSAGNYLGVRLEVTPFSTVARNTVGGNALDGIEVLNAQGTKVIGNTAAGNGISGFGGSGIEFYAPYPFEVSQGSLRANRVSGNLVSGIRVYNSTRTRVEDNIAHGNGLNGMSVSGTEATTVGNVAHGNGFDPPGTSDADGYGVTLSSNLTGSRNKARGNDNPAQCGPNAAVVGCT